MTVVHLISGLSGGGAERFLLELCKASSENRAIRMVVVSLSSANTLEPGFRDAGIEYYFLHINKWTEFFRGWRRMRALLARLQKSAASPVLIHAHMFHACMLGCALRISNAGIPLVFSLHNNHVDQIVRRLLLWCCRSLRSVDILFPGSTRHWYQKRRIRRIGNGIPLADTDKYAAPIAQDTVFTCLFLGRLEPQKDPLSLVRLALQLRDSRRFRILVAGEGSLLEPLRARIAEEKLEDHFELLGFVTDPAPLLARAHCLLLPSRWEGMPLALLEAAAAGIPVITTPTGSIPSFANASNAFIGAVDVFPALVDTVMKDYAGALMRAKNLQKWVSEYCNINRIAQLYADLYREYAGLSQKNRDTP